jgi:hypothetical protein
LHTNLSIPCKFFKRSYFSYIKSNPKLKEYLEILQKLLGSIIKPGDSKVQITHQDWIHQYFHPTHIPQPTISLKRKDCIFSSRNAQNQSNMRKTNKKMKTHLQVSEFEATRVRQTRRNCVFLRNHSRSNPTPPANV